MTTVTSVPVVPPLTRDGESAVQRDTDSEATVSLCKTTDPLIAEHLRALLILCEIPAAVIQRDQLSIGHLIAELLVFSADHARAAAIVAGEKSSEPSSEWNCFGCGETVPQNFDVCWNCCESRMDQKKPGDAEW